jgi:ipoprotein LpqH
MTTLPLAVQRRLVATLLFGICVAGCASATPQSTSNDQLAPGTAQVRIDGRALAVEHRVSCTAEQFWTTITIGPDSQGAQAVIRNASGLIAGSVRIRNLAGFTGSYWNGLGHDARVTAHGSTYAVEGTVAGFRADDPSRSATSTFEIRAAC